MLFGRKNIFALKGAKEGNIMVDKMNGKIY